MGSYKDNVAAGLGYLGAAAAYAPHVATQGYGLYDLATGETHIGNSGELPMNYAIAHVPLLTSAVGGGLGYGAGHLTGAARGYGPKERGMHAIAGAFLGGTIGGYPGAAYAIDKMKDQPTQGLTQNIPMQEVQELNDLLGANGAY